MTKQERVDMYMEYLGEEGYRAEFKDSGVLIFKIEGEPYNILIDEKDEHFFRLIYSVSWEIKDEDERRRVLAACVTASDRTKVLKVVPAKDAIWFSVEMFCNPPDYFKQIFSRSLAVIKTGKKHFMDEMKG